MSDHTVTPNAGPDGADGAERDPLPEEMYMPLRGYSLAHGLRWALMQFAARPFPMLVPGILIMIISGIVLAVSHWLTPTSLTVSLTHPGKAWELLVSYVPPPLDVQTVIVFVLGYIVTLTSSLMLQNATLSGSVKIAEGLPATVRRFVVPRNWSVMVNVTTVLCIALILGAILFIVPALIALYFLQWAIVISLADENPTVWGSIRKSARIVRARPFASLLNILVILALVVIGYLVFYVGIVVAGPIAALFLTYSYFSLEKRQIVRTAPHVAAAAASGATDAADVNHPELRPNP